MNPDKRFLTWLIASLYVGSSFAETPDTTKVYHLENVEIIEKVRPEQTRSGSPLQIISENSLQRIASNNLSDAVKKFSGVTIKDYGGIGGLKTISVRSMGSNHTSISYDGIAVSDCQSGQVDISRFSLGNIARLSLTIGQSDDIFQTARSMASAGNLSIETLRPDLDENNRTLVRANIRSGSFGLASTSLLAGASLNKFFTLTAQGEYLRADGRYPYKFKVGNKVIEGERINSDIQSYRGEMNLFGKFGNRQDLKIKIYYFDSERGLPGAVIIDNPYSAERLADRNGFAQLQYENRISEKFKFKSALKWNYAWNKHSDIQSTGISDDRFTQTESYFSATAHYQPIRNLSVTLSEDVSYNDLTTTLYETQSPIRYTSLTALALQYRWRSLVATGSLLDTYIKEQVKSGKVPPDRKKLSPAMSVSVRPFANSSLRVRASYKDIFRTPTFNDMYYLVIGNSDLKPETTRQTNLGITWNGSRLGFVDQLTLSGDVYYNIVKDKIVAIPTMFVWKMANADKVETIGADINLNGSKNLAKECNLLFEANYSFMQAQDISNRSSKIWRHQLPYTPKHSGSGSLTLETNWLDITYTINFASLRYSLSQNVWENRIERYADHSVSLNRDFRISKHTLKILAAVQNFTNCNYEVIKNYPMPPINYSIALNYAF